MRRGLALFAAVSLFLCDHGQAAIASNNFSSNYLQWNPQPSAHIAGGKEVEPYSFPYQVGLDIRRDNVYKLFCGGALVTNDWILTAAHCVNFTTVQVTVILGAHNLTKENYGRKNVPAGKIVVHPEFDSSSLKNDIALLQINGAGISGKGNIVCPIRLPSTSQKNWWFWNWPETITSGWGCERNSNCGMSSVLQSVSSRVVPTFVCQLLYFSINIGDTHLCVSGWFNKGICDGDSGAPLVVNDTDGQKTLIGIASFNSQFGCDKSIPMGFTRITCYLEWINKITGLNIRS